ncbi:hypothetical protein KO481_08405 [Nocardia sp. NEAU-G5]|uniref:WXG100 family type VII secretion target n=1 Tax=Nocardia albiluteola TaxID=2842303 RepID=A0ABS6AX29_9NOCA|nr:hypothetical protein [Nocardia albiluteola]MBU3061543.1 hypothetical protein [Nocardia albiluteola]
MGSNVDVQTGQLGQFANDLRLSVDAVKNTVKNVSGNEFGDGSNNLGPDSGKNYTDQGKQIKAGLDNIVKWLNAWTDASGAIADNIGASTIAYSTTDAQAAANTNQATNNV